MKIFHTVIKCATGIVSFDPRNLVLYCYWYCNNTLRHPNASFFCSHFTHFTTVTLQRHTKVEERHQVRFKCRTWGHLTVWLGRGRMGFWPWGRKERQFRNGYNFLWLVSILLSLPPPLHKKVWLFREGKRESVQHKQKRKCTNISHIYFRRKLLNDSSKIDF